MKTISKTFLLGVFIITSVISFISCSGNLTSLISFLPELTSRYDGKVFVEYQTTVGGKKLHRIELTGSKLIYNGILEPVDVANNCSVLFYKKFGEDIGDLKIELYTNDTQYVYFNSNIENVSTLIKDYSILQELMDKEINHITNRNLSKIIDIHCKKYPNQTKEKISSNFEKVINKFPTKYTESKIVGLSVRTIDKRRTYVVNSLIIGGEKDALKIYETSFYFDSIQQVSSKLNNKVAHN